MSQKIYIPVAIDLYIYSLNKMNDIHWFENSLIRVIESQIKTGLPSVSNILHKPIHNGLLYQIANLCFYSKFGSNIALHKSMSDLDSLYEFIYGYSVFLGESNLKYHPSRVEFFTLLDEIVELDPNKYVPDLEKNKFLQKVDDILFELQSAYKLELEMLRLLYIQDTQSRLFNDRQLCEYISFSLSSYYGFKGFPKRNSDSLSMIERCSWPKDIELALYERESGICPKCERAFSSKLTKHIDHIVPISKGGTNDVVNLQLLCEECNVSKKDKLMRGETTIPKYFDRSFKRKIKDIDFQKKQHRLSK